jgi:hypothetical protein
MYGKENDGTGPIVAVSADPNNQGGAFTAVDNQHVVTAFGADAFGSSTFFLDIAHEGNHAVYAASYVLTGIRQNVHDAEYGAYQVSAWTAMGAKIGYQNSGVDLWNPTWKTTDLGGWPILCGTQRVGLLNLSFSGMVVTLPPVATVSPGTTTPGAIA